MRRPRPGRAEDALACRGARRPPRSRRWRPARRPRRRLRTAEPAAPPSRGGRARDGRQRRNRPRWTPAGGAARGTGRADGHRADGRGAAGARRRRAPPNQRRRRRPLYPTRRRRSKAPRGGADGGGAREAYAREQAAARGGAPPPSPAAAALQALDALDAAPPPPPAPVAAIPAAALPALEQLKTDAPPPPAIRVGGPLRLDVRLDEEGRPRFVPQFDNTDKPPPNLFAPRPPSAIAHAANARTTTNRCGRPTTVCDQDGHEVAGHAGRLADFCRGESVGRSGAYEKASEIRDSWTFSGNLLEELARHAGDLRSLGRDYCVQEPTTRYCGF